jgi:hypothetical protein
MLHAIIVVTQVKLMLLLLWPLLLQLLPLLLLLLLCSGLSKEQAASRCKADTAATLHLRSRAPYSDAKNSAKGTVIINSECTAMLMTVLGATTGYWRWPDDGAGPC